MYRLPIHSMAGENDGGRLQSVSRRNYISAVSSTHSVLSSRYKQRSSVPVPLLSFRTRSSPALKRICPVPFEGGIVRVGASLRIGRASVRDRHRAVESESAMSAADDVIGICRASRRTKIWSSSPGNVRQFVHNIAPAPPSGAVDSGRTEADLDSAHAEVETALTLVARSGKVDAAKLLPDRRANLSATERFKACRP